MTALPVTELAPPWPDPSVRRFLPVEFGAACRALDTHARAKLALAATHHPSQAAVWAAGGCLVFDVDRSDRVTDEWRVAGTLHLHRCGRSVPVELVVARWSPGRTELRLQVRGRRHTSYLPPRFYEVAHPAMSRLRDVLRTVPLTRRALPVT